MRVPPVLYCGPHTLSNGMSRQSLGLELVSWHLYVRLDVPGYVGEVSLVLFCCFVAHVLGSLAGGFLVAVVGCALGFVAGWLFGSCMRLQRHVVLP